MLPSLVGAASQIGFALPVLAQVRTWEWESHPVWWPFSLFAAGLVLLILFGWALLHLVPLVLGIIAAVYGIRWLRRSLDSHSDPAVAVLRERYARGEITKEEFDAKLRDLDRRP
jgi:uncharacterized membrane protein